MASHKTAGNNAMAARNFGAAADHYTLGIKELEAKPADDAERAAQLHILYSNRAQARLDTKRYDDAVKDATAAIAIDSNFIKSYLRRATAYMRAGKLNEAQADCEALQRLVKAAGANSPVPADSVDALLDELRKAHEARRAKMGEKELGLEWIEATLAANPKAFKLRDSGIAVQVKALGDASTGKSPLENSSCSVHYEGTSRNGDTFDSSIARDDPATFAPSQVIQGWKQLLQLMLEGDEFIVHIPSDYAYGRSGAGGAIGPNATLRFEIRLLKVLDKASKSGAEARKALQEVSGVDVDASRVCAAAELK